MSDIEPIAVEIAYALPDRQNIIELLVEPGTTAYEAAVTSDITSKYPDLNLEEASMGIFGKALGTRGLADKKSYVLKPGDRVEIYRPLSADPKEIRRQRAQKTSAKASAHLDVTNNRN